MQAFSPECPPRAGLRNPGGRADKHKPFPRPKPNPMRPPRFLRTSCPRQKFIMRGLEISKHSKPNQCGVLWVAGNQLRLIHQQNLPDKKLLVVAQRLAEVCWHSSPEIFPSKTLTPMRGTNKNKFVLGFFPRKIIFLAGDRKVSET